jgi:hypothetical protein
MVMVMIMVVFMVMIMVVFMVMIMVMMVMMMCHLNSPLINVVKIKNPDPEDQALVIPRGDLLY